ncbi:glutathione S-transferase [Loktanella ponticola]|uniref:Glutathione S-transferase n=1 Tax=Yoonia ponticola TaxID=1524255 RepID=A0A7W9BMM8_9RHOB|nr:glutathione S-transferase family protein [Yoonia ponticola]MBB5723260.1 glutathione S-transferase [Yoonia ponticola]
MIKVLGRNNSVNVQKVMWCAAELGVAVERVDIGGAFGGNHTDEFTAMNPNRSIPVLIDGDFVLWESNAIVRYLCAEYGHDYWNLQSTQEAGLAEQWMDWYLTTLHPPMRALFWQLIRTAPAAREQDIINKAILDGAKLWEILDHHLATRDFILGDQVSMADIPLGCAAYRWHAMDFKRPDLPHLKAWWDRLVDRPAYREHVMIPLT